MLTLSDGSAITVTADHSFWVDEGNMLASAGWLPARQLRSGDRLRTAGGTDAMVVGLRRNVDHTAVYTLTVAKDHTFFVDPAKVLVHNAVGDCLTVPVRVITGDRARGLVHILLRHLSDSRDARRLITRGIIRTRGAAQFYAQSARSADELRRLLEQAISSPVATFYEDSKGGYIAYIDLFHDIGINASGRPTQVIRLVANAAGDLISAYPY